MLAALVRVLPASCTLCGDAADASLLCAPCMNALPPLPPACPVCALPSPGAAVCGRCLRQPPRVAATLAPCVYAFPLDRLVQAFKYGRRLALAVPLGDALAAMALRAPPSLPRPDALVPMPLARARQRQRGFNQAVEIARVVSRRTRIPLLHALARPLDRPAQASLAWHERRANVRGAFAAVAPATGRHVAIVDDVMTTGATIDAAAAALLAAGAARVDAWVVARALPPGGA
ncbi:MAG: double zinc ribbon domain-containing protein [Betaproteobacteria bacterium]|nr:double zinc ribbon domain-containing protein [Betaproteobacteria bacterium]